MRDLAIARSHVGEVTDDMHDGLWFQAD